MYVGGTFKRFFSEHRYEVKHKLEMKTQSTLHESEKARSIESILIFDCCMTNSVQITFIISG